MNIFPCHWPRDLFRRATLGSDFVNKHTVKVNSSKFYSGRPAGCGDPGKQHIAFNISKTDKATLLIGSIASLKTQGTRPLGDCQRQGVRVTATHRVVKDGGDGHRPVPTGQVVHVPATQAEQCACLTSCMECSF